MRISRIHLSADLRTGNRVQLDQEKAHYVKNVLRHKNGQHIILFDGVSKQDHMAQLCIEGKTVSALLQSTIPKHNDSKIDIHLLQAIGKPEHIDFIVQKGTELGVNHFIFFNTERTQTPLKSFRIEKKIAHWTSVAISACEQCNRNLVPQLSFVNSPETILKDIDRSNGILLDFEGEKFSALYKQLDQDQPIFIATGAEGGFTEIETQQFKNRHFLSCNLGARVLRMETAAISAITLLQHYLGDM